MINNELTKRINALRPEQNDLFLSTSSISSPNIFKLEQLERLRSEDTPCRLMITHTIESYWIPSQKKTKSKLQI